MFQQNANELFFVCVANSRNIIPLFHRKVISHDPLQKNYPNLARTYKNKFYENKINLNLVKSIKKNYYGIIDRGAKKPPPPIPPSMSDRVKWWCYLKVQLISMSWINYKSLHVTCVKLAHKPNSFLSNVNIWNTTLICSTCSELISKSARTRGAFKTQSNI